MSIDINSPAFWIAKSKLASSRELKAVCRWFAGIHTEDERDTILIACGILSPQAFTDLVHAHITNGYPTKKESIR